MLYPMYPYRDTQEYLDYCERAGVEPLDQVVIEVNRKAEEKTAKQ